MCLWFNVLAIIIRLIHPEWQRRARVIHYRISTVFKASIGGEWLLSVGEKKSINSVNKKASSRLEKILWRCIALLQPLRVTEFNSLELSVVTAVTATQTHDSTRQGPRHRRREPETLGAVITLL